MVLDSIGAMFSTTSTPRSCSSRTAAIGFWLLFSTVGIVLQARSNKADGERGGKNKNYDEPSPAAVHPDASLSMHLLCGNTWRYKLIGFGDSFYLHKCGFRCERSDPNTGYCWTRTAKETGQDWRQGFHMLFQLSTDIDPQM